jgi:hypothetical protein
MAMKAMTSTFLCLITMLSLTACAQPAATPEPKPVETEKTITPPVEKAAPTKTQNTASIKESKPMIDIDNPPRGPAIPAAELKKQILALIGSLQSREDTNQENVEKHLGVKMHVDPEWDLNRMYWGQTSEGWRYWFSVTKLRKEPASTIAFYFIHGEKPLGDALPKTCTLDFEKMAEEFQARGFKRNSNEFFMMSGKRSAGFRKIILPEEDLGLSVRLFVYSANSNAEASRLCVNSIVIN